MWGGVWVCGGVVGLTDTTKGASGQHLEGHLRWAVWGLVHRDEAGPPMLASQSGGQMDRCPAPMRGHSAQAREVGQGTEEDMQGTAREGGASSASLRPTPGQKVRTWNPPDLDILIHQHNSLHDTKRVCR